MSENKNNIIEIEGESAIKIKDLGDAINQVRNEKQIRGKHQTLARIIIIIIEKIKNKIVNSDLVDWGDCDICGKHKLVKLINNKKLCSECKKDRELFKKVNIALENFCDFFKDSMLLTR